MENPDISRIAPAAFRLFRGEFFVFDFDCQELPFCSIAVTGSFDGKSLEPFESLPKIPRSRLPKIAGNLSP
jgi:hypothetical protein